MAEEEPREEESEEDDLSQKTALFQEITGINDITQCQEILQAHHWNVEAAVQDAFNEREGGQPVFNAPLPPPPPRPAPPVLHTINEPPLPRPRDTRVTHPSPVGWWEWLLSWGFLPIRWVLSATNELAQFLVGLVFGNQPALPANPVADVQQFITEFEREYGTTHPPFLSCSYSEALDQAKRDLKFLLIYMHSAGHQDTPSFCRDVLTSQTFIQMLSSHGCVFWGVGVDSEEGVRVSYTLRETTYPFLATVMLRGSRMTVVGRLEGYSTVSDVVERLEQIMSRNGPELVVLRAERQQRNLDTRLRQEQEEEFLLSLRADQEKARKREEEISEAARRAEEERQREEEKKREAEEFERERREHISRLPPEPSLEDSSVVHVSIKMSDGERIDRRFEKNAKLQSLYDLAYTYENIPKRFMLFSNYPRKELLCDLSGGPTLEQLDFARKMLVFVQDMTEEEEEEDEEN